MAITLHPAEYGSCQFPAQVELSYREKEGTGRKVLCTRFNAHPERDGLYAEGKYFFPDKSWEDPVEGPALVTIANEEAGYGYLVGEPIKLPNVLDKKVSHEFIWYLKNQIEAKHPDIKKNAKIGIANSPVRGRYVFLQGIEENRNSCDWQKKATPFSAYFSYCETPDGIVFSYNRAEWLRSDIRQHSERTMTADELVCEYLLKRIRMTEPEIMEKCREAESTWLRVYKASLNNPSIAYVADKYRKCDIPQISDLLDDCYDTGIIFAYRMKHAEITFFSFNMENLTDLMYFSNTEIKELFRQMKAYNTESDTKLAEMYRRKEVYTTYHGSAC